MDNSIGPGSGKSLLYLNETIIRAIKQSWIWALFFAAGIVLGMVYFDKLSQALLPIVFDTFDAVLLDSQGEPRPPFSLAIAIFLNNSFVAAICFISAKVTRGLLPGFILLFNGVVIGVLAVLTNTLGVSLGQFLIMLIPHGIFELPALFIACAIGWRGLNKETLYSMWFPIAMLFFAALVEVYFTPMLY